MDPNLQDPLVRAIKRLTIAVWALVALFGVYVAIYLCAYIPSFGPGYREASSEAVASSPPSPSSEPFQQLHGLPPEEMVRIASVIAISKHEVEGQRGKCVLSEILKHSPGVRFYYKLGDELQHCSFDPKEGLQYGEGQVTFFVGNPAEMRYATTVFGGRISGLGQMPIDELRRLIVEEQKSTK